MSMGSPQGCVLSPLLFYLLTHDCSATLSSKHIIKFADDTTVVDLISSNDESVYRMEVLETRHVMVFIPQLVSKCGTNKADGDRLQAEVETGTTLC